MLEQAMLNHHVHLYAHDRKNHQLRNSIYYGRGSDVITLRSVICMLTARKFLSIARQQQDERGKWRYETEAYNSLQLMPLELDYSEVECLETAGFVTPYPAIKEILGTLPNLTLNHLRWPADEIHHCMYGINLYLPIPTRLTLFDGLHKLVEHSEVEDGYSPGDVLDIHNLIEFLMPTVKAEMRALSPRDKARATVMTERLQKMATFFAEAVSEHCYVIYNLTIP